MKKRINTKKNKINFGLVKKNHAKVSFKSVRYFLVNNIYYKQLFDKIETSLNKRRKQMSKKLVKMRLVVNYRQIFRKISDIGLMNQKLFFFNSYNSKFDPLFAFYKKYSFVGLVAQSYYNITDYHLEMLRRTLRQKLGKYIFFILRLQANKIIFKRTLQVRMGGGKGSKFSKKIHMVKPGSILLEVRGCSYSKIMYYYKLINKKLGFKTKIVVFNRI